MLQWTGGSVSPNNTFEFCNGSNWVLVNGAAGSVPLSGLSASTTANTFDNSNYAQTWTWNSLSTGTALAISSTSITTGSLLSLQDTAIANTSTGKVLSLSDTTTGPGYGVYSSMSGLANTGYAGYFSNTTSTGAGYALYATTSTTGAGYGIYATLPQTTNTGYAGYFNNADTNSASYGVYGTDTSSSGYGGYFKNTSTGWALYVNGNANITGSVQIGSTSLSCTTSNAGALQYTTTYGPEYCNGSAWTPFSYCSLIQPYQGYLAGPAFPSVGMWSDGTYFYTGANDGAGSNPDLEAFTYNNSTHTWMNVAYTTAASAFSDGNIWGDGTYLYLPQGPTGIQAYTFNGTSFTAKGSYTTSMNANWVWGYGGYIYVADTTNGLKAFTFNGTSFTLKGTVAPSGINAQTVWGDGTYIYVADAGNQLIRAYTFNGSTFTSKGSYTTNNAPSVLWGDGTYIYATEYTAVEAYTFSGTAFTLKGTYYPIGDDGGQIVGENGDLYIAGPAYVEVASFKGSSFTYKGVLPVYSGIAGIWADSNNVYISDAWGYDVDAYPLCH